MFQDIESNKKILIGIYRKLKGYYYYNKSMLFIRKTIADFEWNEEIVDETFNKLAILLKDPDKKENISYIEDLISNIDYSILPKTFSEEATVDKELNLDGNSNNKKINEVNFFIKAPIELLILDTLWAIFLGKIGYDNKSNPKYSYGNILKSTLYYEDIDFFSSTMFEYYAYKYTKWRDNAFKEIKKNYNNKTNSILISLDLKSYFYSSNFSFEKLDDLFGSHPLYGIIKGLTSIIKKAYLHYSKILAVYRKDINDDRCIFPIGFLSALVLSDYYLKSFDELVVQKLKCKYYGRYVDDILLVLDGNQKQPVSKNKLINELFINTGIFTKNERELCLSIYPNLKIQRKKINMFYISYRKSKNLVDIYNEMIKIKPSEENILPDFKLDELSFDENAYFLSNIMKNTNLDDLKFIKTK